MNKLKVQVFLLLAIVSTSMLLTGCKSTGNEVSSDTHASQSMSQHVEAKPETETISYPIQRIVNGKVHSISAYPTGHPSTSLMLIERIAPAQVNLGQPFDTVINITNISSNTLNDVKVTEPYSSHFKYGSATPAPSSHEGGTLVWDLGDLEAQDTQTLTLQGSATAVGVVSDCVTVAYTPRACIAIEVVEPKLQLAQTGPASVVQCDPIPITLTVTNNGTGLAKNVVIREQLPKGLVTLDNKEVVVREAGDLKAGESKTFKINLKALEARKYSLKANAVGAGNLDSFADYAVSVVKPVLVMSKSGPEKRFVGRPASYDITVSNKGNGPASNLIITESLAEGATFVSASDGGKFSSGTVTWNLGTLAPEASKKVSVRVKLDKIGTAQNIASAKAVCAETSAKSSIQVVGIPAILLEVVDLSDPLEVGSNETYVISVTNQGTAPGTKIRIVATLPAEQEYITSSGPTKANVSGRKVTFILPSLDPKATAEYRVVVKGVEAGDLRFRVDLQSAQMSSPVMETESTNVY